MPCYEPPPPYEQAHRKNAELAVRLLCNLIAPRVKDETLETDLLLWFIEHRRIDMQAEINEAARCARQPDANVLGQIEKDIEMARMQVLKRGQADETHPHSG